MQTHTDVVIVGAGPVGLMLAAELRMQRNLVSYGLISRQRAAFNVAARSAYRALPTGLLRRVYAVLFHRGE